MAHGAVNGEINSEAAASNEEGESNGVDSVAHLFESPHDDVQGSNSQGRIPRDHALPSWFLRNCVKSADTLKTHQVPLIIREREVYISQTAVTEALELGCNDSIKDTKATTFDELKMKKTEIESKIYEVEPVVYEAMYLALQQPQLLVKPTGGRVSASVTKALRFNFNSMYLRFPDHQRDRGIKFLTAIVEYFSQEIGADLITLHWDDILDLAEYFGKSKQKTQEMGAEKLAQKYFERKSRFPLKQVTGSRIVKRWRGFPFHHLLHLPTKVDDHDTSAEGFKRNPLVIHIPGIHSYAGARSYIYHAVTPDHRSNVITDLLDAIITSGKDNDILLVATSNTAGSEYDEYIMPLLRVHANRSPTCMVSIWSEAQQRMHRSDDKNGEYYRAKNVRQIQRKLREWNAYGSSPPLLEPYTEWEFLGTTESSPHLEYLAKKTLSSVVIKQLAEAISGNMDKKTIKKSIMGVARRQEAIDEWHDSLTPDLVDTVPDDKWSTFSPGVQQNIRKIESDPWTYPGELKFLDQLVNHKNIEETWSDIELDPEIRESITQMVDQPLNSGRTAYGILKKGRIGGALLYGPPGTGKTHLARVLARETQAVMISVSAADIENMFVGETEKAVKGLFSLGRMLAPSIIFIDEADALFRARSSQDTGYERSRTNQFLYEMDGLIKSETPPFVLLATNFPRQLDHAVLRRTPSRIHIGLPSAEGRERIFNICLREEQLHTDVKVQVLANMTKGYTGSDIRTLCIQAALACEAAMTSRGPETVRILRADHFEKAFRRCSPTVSRSALAHIREFAKEFDSAALSKLDAAAIEIQAKDLDNKSDENDPTISKNRNSKDITSNNVDRHPQSIFDVFTQLGIPSQIPEPRIQEVFSDAENPNPENPESRLAEVDSDAEDPEVVTRPTMGLDTEDPEFGESHGQSSQDSGSANARKHIYQPLERDSKQIRVLSIYPIADMSRSRMSAAVDGGSSSSGMLSCTLKTVDLDDKTPLCRRVETDGFAYLQKANPTTGSSVKRQRAFWNETSSVLQEYEGRLEDLLGANISEVSDEIDAKMESNFESPLLGTGKVVSRFNWGDYLALSYVWGDPLQREQILLDGHEFSVTRNLHRALLHLAESQEVALKGLCVWIDALCINQDDLEERSSQVKIMELIYSEAHAVCAYIGSPPSDMKVDAEIDAAISWLKNVRSMKTSDLDEFNDADVGISAPNDEITYCISMLASKIFQESYWERMWVMQEIILAPSILWWYGRWTFGTRELHNMREIFSRSMSSTDALRLQSVFSDLSGEPPLPPRILWRITIMYTRLKILKEWRYDVIRRPLRLIDILTLAQSSRATDLRDKVYGILTLLPKGLSAQIYPNYGLGYGVREAYIEFTKLCLLEKGGLKEGGLNMLSRIHIGPDRELDVPSWVLPLETDPGIPLAPDRTLGHRYQKFHASSSLTYKVTFSEDNMIMSCEGILVDSIDTLAAKKKTLYYPDFEHEYSGCESTSLLLNTIWDSRLALARVLLGDPNYEFANGPSPFDVPWIDLDYLGGFDEFRTGYMINKTVHTDEIKWQVFAYQSAFKDIFHVDLIPNETFKFHGVPLKDYFDSREILLGKTEVYANLGIEILNSLTARRLCTTRNGLLGLAPLFAKPGDRIAILFGCNIPLILRPRGDNYEYIGSCFVEGLMKGEAVIGIEHNREDVREINIC